MRLSFYKNTRIASQAAAEIIDIDVTPVMNMFVILIPFLVSVAVFAHMSIIEFSLPPNVGASLDNSNGKPQLKLTVVIANDYVAITHGENLLDSIPKISQEYNNSKLFAKLSEHRKNVDIKDEIIVAVRDAIRFKYVVAIMDRCREAGFLKVGLSSAPENPEQV